MSNRFSSVARRRSANSMAPALRAKACLFALLCVLAPMVALGQVMMTPPGLPLSGGVLTGPLTFSSGSFSTMMAIATNGEFLIQNNVAAVNVFAVENNSTVGFSAYTVRSADQQYPSTLFSPDGNYEHMAFGFGQGLPLNGFSGYDYIEISRFDAQSNVAIPPPRLSIQQTGGVLTAGTSTTAFTCATTINSTAMTCTTNAPANGSQVYSPWLAGVITPKTTITSGGGTTTPTLSVNALSTQAAAYLLIGAPTYLQTNSIVFQEQGPIDFYSWGNGGTSPGNPFFVLDRQNGRVGIKTGNPAAGNLVSDLPVTDLDLVGFETVGKCSTANRTSFGTSYPITVCDAGPNMVNLFKAGVDQLHINWNATPSRVDFVEANGPTTPLSLFMDGTATVRTGGALADATYDYQTPTTGTTVTLSNSKYHEVIDPAGTLATLTVNMPPAPIDGQYVDVRFSQIITALTVSGNGHSIAGNPTSAAVGSQFGCIYRNGNTTWYC